MNGKGMEFLTAEQIAENTGKKNVARDWQEVGRISGCIRKFRVPMRQENYNSVHRLQHHNN